ncbi:hypothetical protein B0O79_2711 [Flavobacteriaceae bacterium MAR_2009_75]|nr:hypothetical protein B0O79_2711 [Flavobacteriaceae bacterium MAR_2009_75]
MNTNAFIGFVIGIASLLYFRKNVLNTYWKCLWRSGILFFSMYVLILIIMAAKAHYLGFKLEALDLNHNGQIDIDEYTAEYRSLRDQLLQDPDRNNAFSNGALLSFVMGAIAFAIDLFTTYFQSKTDRIKI